MLNERLRFVKRRMLETIVEFNYAQGKIKEWPTELAKPPDWAIDASLYCWKSGQGAAFKHVTKEEIRRDPRGALKEITAIFEGLRAYVVNPSHDAKDPLEVRRVVSDLHKHAEGLVAKRVLTQFRKLDARLEKLLPPATASQLVQWGDRYQRGIRAATENPGGVIEGTATTKIYYLIWFFWPKLIAKPLLTAAVLRQWFIDQVGFTASDKLVEAAHTKLKLASRHNKKKRQPNSDSS
jgi:hypothetical protein